MCTALQAVASPLGHSTAGIDARSILRADDGIRTRDPHLGKVMRYQLRHVRAQRTRSSPDAKPDNSPSERAHTTPFEWACLGYRAITRDACGAFGGSAGRASLPPRSPLGAGPVAQWKSVRFTRGRSLVRSQPGPQASSSNTADLKHRNAHEIVRRMQRNFGLVCPTLMGCSVSGE